MPLEANIIPKSGSGKENLMLIFISMTFWRTVLFDEKKEDPAFAGLTAVS